MQLWYLSDVARYLRFFFHSYKGLSLKDVRLSLQNCKIDHSSLLAKVSTSTTSSFVRADIP